MCGIAGFTGAAAHASSIARAMISALAHRGPDAQAVHVSDHVTLAHARLAVVDLAGGAQPMVDQETGNALVFNGEIYGFRELANEAAQCGIPLRDASDTAVLFALLQHGGVSEALRQIEGMFAFAWWDAASRTLTLARDRFGEKPLYWAKRGKLLAFGSEASAILCHPVFAHVGPDPEAAAALLRFEYLPGTWSGWESIEKLPPASLLSWQDGDVALSCYWSPPLPRGRGPVEGEAIERLDADLKSAVRRQIVADVPLGVFLSGGLDSSLIAALAAREAPGITALSVRAGQGSFDETAYAAATARHIGIAHRIVDLQDADLAVALDTIADRLSEPLADSSLLPTFLVCRAARQTMTVALGGDGADELFAGYPNFRVRRFARAMQALPPSLGAAVTRALDALPPAQGYMNLRFRLAQLAQGFGAPADAQSYLWMAPFGPAREQRLWRDKPAAERLFDAVLQPNEAERHPDGVERLLHQFLLTYLPDDILTKTDRAAMFNSLEVRAPFLDVSFASYAARLPRGLKIGRLGPKHILKQVALRYLPRDIVVRKKHGFALPVGALLRGPLRQRLSDTLLSRANPVADWFNRSEVEALLQAHLAGRTDAGKRLWALFILFIVASRNRGPAATSR